MRHILLLPSVLFLTNTFLMTASASDVKCHDNWQYVVMEQPVANAGVGTNFTIYKKTKASQKVTCPVKNKGAWKIPNKDAEYYLGQAGDLLVLDSGTSEQGRSIILWNLAQKKSIQRFPYANEAKVKRNELIYWVRSNDKVTSKNCPNLKALTKLGLDKAIDYKHILNLKTMKVKNTKVTQCSGVS